MSYGRRRSLGALLILFAFSTSMSLQLVPAADVLRKPSQNALRTSESPRKHLPCESSVKQTTLYDSNVLLRGLRSLLLSFTISFSAASPAFAIDSKPYWDIMNSGTPEERIVANKALLNHALGTINTMYYDRTGGAFFEPRNFVRDWRHWLQGSNDSLQTRDGAIQGMRYLVSQLQDPYSHFLTRDELQQELVTRNDGFLGIGAMVEPAQSTLAATKHLPSKSKQLSPQEVAKLPVVTAVAPHSPAERSGVTVGDRILAVGHDQFLPLSSNALSKRLTTRYHAENYVGFADLTVAKPIYSWDNNREVVLGFRPTHVKLQSRSIQETPDRIVDYQLLPASSIFGRDNTGQVGYIRLTRFSKVATTGFLNAVQELEQAGATAYIIDLRNNYGGVIQEALLSASVLLRDPQTVLCYTMNARGGFVPHEVGEFVVDARYPGYLLSRESSQTTMDQIRKEKLSTVEWPCPSAYASIHEQSMKRGFQRVGSTDPLMDVMRKQRDAQKKIALLVNEGTASSAEVFTGALHDNGRTVAVIGTKTYGKGLIQHTFPLPDGAGLRLTVAEFLTPSLRHVTKIGGAQYDQKTGQLVGGGIVPDVSCDSKYIPSNVGGDFCVGMALDALDEADDIYRPLGNNVI